MFQHVEGREYWVFVQCKEGTSRGLQKNFWGTKGAFGFEKIGKNKLKKEEYLTGDGAIKKLDAITIDDKWDPENTPATKWCEDNESRLRKKAAIKKNPED